MGPGPSPDALHRRLFGFASSFGTTRGRCWGGAGRSDVLVGAVVWRQLPPSCAPAEPELRCLCAVPRGMQLLEQPRRTLRWMFVECPGRPGAPGLAWRATGPGVCVSHESKHRAAWQLALCRPRKPGATARHWHELPEAPLPAGFGCGVQLQRRCRAGLDPRARCTTSPSSARPGRNSHRKHVLVALDSLKGRQPLDMALGKSMACNAQLQATTHAAPDTRPFRSNT